MKLKDLKSGMAIQMKNGQKYLIVGFGNELAFLCETGQTLIPETFITNDLECISDYTTLNDIIIVYKIPPCTFQDFPKFCCKEYIIWERKENKNPFGKVKKGSFYYSNSTLCEVNEWNEGNDAFDRTIYLIANYYNNKEFAIRQAKSEVLNRLLKRFSYENGWNDDLWKELDTPKYHIEKDMQDNVYDIYDDYQFRGLTTIYFISYEIAQRAIDEIIIPFEQGKLEVCKIWE